MKVAVAMFLSSSSYCINLSKGLALCIMSDALKFLSTTIKESLGRFPSCEEGGRFSS